MTIFTIDFNQKIVRNSNQQRVHDEKKIKNVCFKCDETNHYAKHCINQIKIKRFNHFQSSQRHEKV